MIIYLIENKSLYNQSYFHFLMEETTINLKTLAWSLY